MFCCLTCSDYKEYHTDTTVHFVVTMSEEELMAAENLGFYKKFNLTSAINTTNMVSLTRLSITDWSLDIFFQPRETFTLPAYFYLGPIWRLRSNKEVWKCRWNYQRILWNSSGILWQTKGVPRRHANGRGREIVQSGSVYTGEDWWNYCNRYGIILLCMFSTCLLGNVFWRESNL